MKLTFFKKLFQEHLSNCFDLEQDQGSDRPDLGPNVCKDYQLMTKVPTSKERYNNLRLNIIKQIQIIFLTRALI